jgi:hypothetical protein
METKSRKREIKKKKDLPVSVVILSSTETIFFPPIILLLEVLQILTSSQLLFCVQFLNHNIMLAPSLGHLSTIKPNFRETAFVDVARWLSAVSP